MNSLRDGIACAARNATRRVLGAVLTIGLLAALCAAAASVDGPKDGPKDGAKDRPKDGPKVHIITHVDVAPLPPAPGTPVNTGAVPKKFQEVTAEAETLLRQFAVDSRRDPGCVSFQVIQEPQRRNHFTLVHVWQDEASFLAHEAAAHTRAMRTKLQPILGGPMDQRLHVLFE